MPAKATATGIVSCFKCKNALHRSDDRIKCGFCRKAFHLDCAVEITPGMTKDIAIAMKECSDVLLFKCQPCKAGNILNLSDIAAKLDDMENRLEQIPKQVSSEISIKINEMSSRIDRCLTEIEHVENKTSTKLKQLELENNSLQRQMNRGDIIISGIPSLLRTENLLQLAINIGKHYNVDLAEFDINTCFWINKKKNVLVKFNNIMKRDKIIKKYHLNYDLKLNQIYCASTFNKETDALINMEIGDTGEGNKNKNGIESRVFLNDNLTRRAEKINYLGRKLMKEKKIKKFKLFNGSDPKIKLTLEDGSQKLCTLDELQSLQMNFFNA